MTGTELANRAILQRLDQTLKQLTDQVRQRVPALRCSIHHGRNENFPWWIVARFVNSADETKVVDVSVDCQGNPQEWIIRADVAREDGLVLQEIPAIKPVTPGTGPEANGQIETVVKQLEGFLAQQVQCIAQELG